MIVTCPRCLTKFNLPEGTSVSGAELNLHCSRCGCDFHLPDQSLADVRDVSEELLAPEPEGLENVAGETLDSDGLEGEAAPIDASSAEIESADDFIEEVFDDSIFELSDDFDDETSSSDVQPAVQEDAIDPIKKSDDVKLEELALDIDDLNLDDIEFDSFGDEPDSVDEIEEVSEDPQNVRSTQLDDGDLDNLINQVDEQPEVATVSTDKEGRIKESGEQVVVDSLAESSSPSSGQVKTPENTNKKRSLFFALLCFVVLSLALWAGYGLWQRFSVDMVKHIQLIEVENQRLRLPSERTVIVMRGKVVNSSSKLVTDLKLTGVLLDKAGRTVVKVVTAGGVSFSEEELDRLDASKLAMLENSTITLAANGGELPFMIAFYDYPEKVSKCYVELTSFKVKKGRRP